MIARQAQSYALGIKKSALGSDDYFGFGVHFDKTAPTTIILFTDSDSDKSYDDGELFPEIYNRHGRLYFRIDYCCL